MKIEICLVSWWQSCSVIPETVAAVELCGLPSLVCLRHPWTAHHITDCPTSPSHTSILIWRAMMTVGTASCQLITTCSRTFRRHHWKIMMLQILVTAVSLLLFVCSLPCPSHYHVKCLSP
ncbi:hypothetical protein LEMLEM_LOCUS8771 [Lemmus lemmus]